MYSKSKPKVCPGRWKEISTAYDRQMGSRVWKCQICGREVNTHGGSPKGCGKEI